MENWSNFCNLMKPEASSELELESRVEAFLKETLHGDVNRQFNVQFGHEHKRGDLLLNNELVIEMKRQDILFGDEEVGQLRSYMRQEKHKFGLLIGSYIEFWYDMPDKNQPIRMVFRSNFDDIDSKDGKELFTLLEKTNFDTEKLENFCKNNFNKYLDVYQARRDSITRRGFHKSTNAKILADTKTFCNEFVQKYGSKNSIINKMMPGKGRDIFSKIDVYQYGIIFGKNSRVEMRSNSIKKWRELFEPNLEKIKSEIKDMNIAGGNKPTITKSIDVFGLTQDEVYRRYFEESNIFINIIERIINGNF